MRLRLIFPLLAVAVLVSPLARAENYAAGNELAIDFVMPFKEQIKAANKQVGRKAQISPSVMQKLQKGVDEGLPRQITTPKKAVRSFVPAKFKYAPFNLKTALRNSQGGRHYLFTGKVGKR